MMKQTALQQLAEEKYRLMSAECRQEFLLFAKHRKPSPWAGIFQQLNLIKYIPGRCNITLVGQEVIRIIKEKN